MNAQETALLFDNTPNVCYIGSMNMSRALQDAIRKDGRSQGQIADAAGVDRGALSRFLRDQRSVTLDSADRLLGALKLDCRLVKRTKGGGK